MKWEQIEETIRTKFKGKAVEKASSSIYKNGERCCYLTKDGKKCGMGIFIPDGHEAQEDENTVIGTLGTYPDLWDYMPSQDGTKLREFQQFHDDKLTKDMPLEEQKNMLVKKAMELFPMEAAL